MLECLYHSLTRIAVDWMYIFIATKYSIDSSWLLIPVIHRPLIPGGFVARWGKNFTLLLFLRGLRSIGLNVDRIQLALPHLFEWCIGVTLTIFALCAYLVQFTETFAYHSVRLLNQWEWVVISISFYVKFNSGSPSLWSLYDSLPNLSCWKH